MADRGTAVVHAGAAFRGATDRLEQQLLLSGMLSPARSKALRIVRAACEIALDFMPSGVEPQTENMGDTTVVRNIETILGK